MNDAISIPLELSDEDAEALAQYLKRAGFSDFRALARDDDEAYAMQAAAERLRTALAAAGHAPR